MVERLHEGEVKKKEQCNSKNVTECSVWCVFKALHTPLCRGCFYPFLYIYIYWDFFWRQLLCWKVTK